MDAEPSGATTNLSGAPLEHICELMNLAIPHALVESDSELEESLSLPDANDNHVLAIAIRGEAQVIVTENVKDFPAKELAPYGLVAKTSDEFVLSLLDVDPDRVCLALFSHRRAFRRPPLTAEEYLLRMRRNCLEDSATQLEELGCQL